MRALSRPAGPGTPPRPHCPRGRLQRSERRARPRQRTLRRGADGFTLIEVLVAFVILAVASVAIYRGFSSGLSGIGVAGDRTIAVLHARSKLDEVGTTIPVEPGETAGTFEDGLPWTVTVEPFAVADDAFAFELPMAVFQVTVTVEDAGGAQVVLTTYRLALLP